MTDSRWVAWAAARPPVDGLHLDTAAVGRQSLATLSAVAEHARLEAEMGGYVAEAHAVEQLTAARRDIATLLGTDEEGLVFSESGTTAFETLVRAWPLPESARVATAAAAWGPNLEVLRHHGHRTELLTVDGHGVVDLDALERLLREDPPDVVFVDHAAAHRGLVQPAAEILALGREHGVPVWLDAAQSAGQVVVPVGADALVATSRKWLTGPRGVGLLVVAEPHRAQLRARRTTKHPDWSPMRLLESEEAHVAGRVGLGVAARELLDLDPVTVAARLEEVGRSVRDLVSTVDGWEVVDPGAPASATTAVRATGGQDVEAAAARMLSRHGVVTTVSLPWRSPHDMSGMGPLLRLSPHVDLEPADLERLAAVLSEES